MTVAETTSIDQGALQDNGRLLLAMTEVRLYRASDIAAMVEQFRLKLNAYVYAIRSGQLSDAGPDGQAPTGYDIVLFCPEDPHEDVQKMISVAGESLAAEGVTVGWRVLADLRAAAMADFLPPSELNVEELQVALARAIVSELPEGWIHAEYHPAVVMGRSEDQLVVRTSERSQTLIEPSSAAREIVLWLKHKMFVAGRGTWLSASFTLTPDGSFGAEYNYDVEPLWSRPLDDTSYAKELEAYPRELDHVPGWWAARLGS